MRRKPTYLLALPLLLLLGLLSHAYGAGGVAQADTPTTTPTVSSTPSTPSAVSITATPSSKSAGCGGTVAMAISVLQGSVPVPDGTNVSITSNVGSVSPQAVTTMAGKVSATFTAPPTSVGLATVRVIALSTTVTVPILLNCGTQSATIALPQATCSGNSANVSFSWTPAPGATQQWLDLSLNDNGFAPGTFIGAGPLAGGLSQMTWPGLLAGYVHYWRVNSLTPTGWLTSSAGSFVPCGGPQLVNSTYTCSGPGRATFNFNWIPATPGGASYVDITTFNNAFAPGTFIGTQVTGMQTYSWQGIVANQVQYWRVNTLLPQGWFATNQLAFFGAC